jgi:hypothetical protein
MSSELLLNYVDIDSVVPYNRNSRINDETVEVVARSISAYGFNQPIVVDKDNIIVVGHARHAAAKSLGLTTVPVVVFEGTKKSAREYRLMDNKSQEYSRWDYDVLAHELSGLSLDTGFSMSEINTILDGGTAVDYIAPSIFEVVVETDDEPSQLEVFKYTTSKGYKCRLLSI